MLAFPMRSAHKAQAQPCEDEDHALGACTVVQSICSSKKAFMLAFPMRSAHGAQAQLFEDEDHSSPSCKTQTRRQQSTHTAQSQASQHESWQPL
eukprot:1156136-Pelagomonas_calceolata.AAC.2